ncbi:MAG TPA: hypothetical protein VN578_22225 [Candidatus Binatia bacterium]|jgi:hypothetical protein|nr:hypothetical protein [Candidatus Binatia bacterium]
MKKEKTLRFFTDSILSGLEAAQSKTIKAIMVCASSAGMFIAGANAQPNVTWQTPATISGTSDVSTQGVYCGSWAPQDGSANSFPVNGVTFQGFSDIQGLTAGATLDNGYNGFGSPNTSDANYNTLLQYARFSNEGTTPATFSWSGMIPGSTYLVQFWVNDGRNIGESRSETITGGANTAASLSYGSDGSGPGQYIIGTFVADNSRGQTLTLTASSSGSNPDPQINLFQVRDITLRPNVTWRAPVTISGTADVSTQGIYFGSWAPQDGSANTFPVNGVTFQGFSDLPFFTSGPTFDSGYNSYGSPNTSDTNYNTLLQSARYSNEGSTPATFSWAGMTPGHVYLIEFWVNDGRNIGQSRTETITGGTNTSAPLSFGSDGSGPGQYIIGTFVANSSGGQTLSLTAFSTGANPSPQVNLFQVRDITPVITRVAVRGTTLTITATNGPANGTFVLLESANVTLPLTQWTPVLTNSFNGNGGLNLSTNVVNPSNPREFYILRTQE